jgi:PAS domain S-box-containing protein
VTLFEIQHHSRASGNLVKSITSRVRAFAGTTKMSHYPRRQGYFHTLMMVLGIAAAYYVTGRLGLLFAIPPGYATAVWLPSGIALSAILIGGYRVWPGVLLGSWLLNMALSLEATNGMALLKGVALPTSIGLGAALQAVVGAYLVRRVVGFPNPLSRERDIGVFLGLGGPVSCLTNATVGVTNLLIAGKIPWVAYFHNWWTWWIGDTIGVLIVTPLLLSWLAEPRDIWRRRRLSVAVPLVGAFTLAVVVFMYTSGQERERQQLIFERQAESLAYTLEGQFDRYLEVLRSIARFYASSQEVTRDEFRTFVRGALAHQPGIQALSWDRYVPDVLREAYEESVRQEGDADFQITEQDAQGQIVRATRRPEYVVVSYIEPHAGNEKALGYDASSNSARLDALQRARDSGRAIATGRLMLVQETSRQFGLLIFQPIYSHGPPPTTVEERRQRLLGYATGVFRIGDMIEVSLPGAERNGIMLRIEDEAAPAGQRLLYDSQREAHPTLNDAPASNPSRMRWDTTLEVADRRWVLRLTSTLGYLAARQSLQPWTVLIGGLLFTSLLGAFLLFVTGRSILIEQVVAERTNELSQTNAALAHEIAEREQAESRFSAMAHSAVEAIVSADSVGHILTWNNGAYAIFGYTAEEVVGQPLTKLMPERYHELHRRGIERMGATGESALMGTVLVLDGLHKDGREFPLELTLSTWTSVEGRFYGGIMRDITKRQQAEQALRQTAAELAQSNAELAQFAYVASHDLQEPLRAVAGCVQLLQQRYSDQLDGRAHELIAHAVAGATRMHTLIQDLLAYSQVGTRGESLQPTACAVVLKDALTDLEVSIRESGAVVTAAPLPTVMADAAQLRLVFQNLIGNALKFRGEAPPTIRIGVERQGGAWVFAVCDNGIGIHPQYFERIFQVFQRLHTQRKYDGSGIGLAICKKIVERHGGRIWVTSETGKGATFSFSIPDLS